MQFEAFDRDFKLVLRQGTPLLDVNATVSRTAKGHTTHHAADTTMFLHGHVADDEASAVHGWRAADVTFHGFVWAAGEKYHIEPARWYFGAAHDAFDSVMFRAADLRSSAMPNQEVCGKAHDRVVVRQQELFGATPFDAALRQRFANQARAEMDAGHLRERQRRAATACTSKCTCPVLLIADQKFFQSPVGQNSADYTVAHMVQTMADVDTLYRRQDFSVAAGENQYGFSVNRIRVFEDASGDNPVPGDSYTANDYLEAFSNPTWGTGSCLVHMFTYREFSDGILGLAWVGSPSNAGACDTQGFNTGFTTSLNFGRTVSTAVTTVTTAHEFGHNWGSPHDPTSCSPGAPNGNFVMYPQATDGSLPNNVEFSQCSRDSMGAIIGAKKDKCFDDSRAVCGNGIVESGEVCDCGEPCDPTKCCQPAGTENECQPAGECSPQDPLKSPCCTAECKFAATTVSCSPAAGCVEEAFCSGNDFTCPLPNPKPDDTLCNCQDDDCAQFPLTASKICQDGKCTGSLCALFDDATPCSLSGDQACTLSCQGPNWGDGAECVSTTNVALRHPNVSDFYTLAPASSCDNFKGYCNDDSPTPKCIVVDSRSLLDKLEDFLKNFTAEAAWKWIKENWKYLLIGVGCFIVLLIGMRLTYRRRKVKVELTNDQEPLLGGSRPIVGGAPPLGSRPWLHGSLSKHAAEKILASAGCDGAFLLRSGKHGSYYLSVFADRRPQHFHLIRDERDGQLYVQFHQTVKFRDLDVLVSQFSNSSMDVLPCTLAHPVVFGKLGGRRPLG